MAHQSFKPESTFISKVEHFYGEHDGKRVAETLTIHFSDGGILEYISYDNDLESLYEQMKNEKSVGKFWHKNIKNKYQYKRIK